MSSADPHAEPPDWWVAVVAEQVERLKSGTRVQIRLHGEYPEILLSNGGRMRAHQPTEDGRVGVVTEIIRDETACMFRVRFDAPFAPFPTPPEIRAMFPSIPETTIDEWLYTAPELTVLTPAEVVADTLARLEKDR